MDKDSDQWKRGYRDDTRYLSWGAGVNSTAIIALYILGRLGNRRPEIVFADTGGELPDTYQYIEQIKMILGSDAVTIIRPDTHSEIYPPRVDKKNLYEKLYEDKIMPHFNGRFCTSDWKVRPLDRYGNKRKKVLGICKDELHRMRDSENIEYPLRFYSRDDCIRLINEAGLPPASKTSCFFCPFKDKASWMKLYREHKDLFVKCVDLEEQTKFRYFKNKTLEEQIKRWVYEEEQALRQMELVWFP